MDQPGCHVTEVVGASDESVEAAIHDGVCRATCPTDSLEWLEIVGVHSNVLRGVHRFRVDLRVGVRSAAA